MKPLCNFNILAVHHERGQTYFRCNTCRLLALAHTITSGGKQMYVPPSRFCGGRK